jgi:hypothetical protein
VALVLLTGCNMVITHKPMFAAADGAGAPAPRSGLWRLEFHDDCKVDEAQPLKQWPSCAGGVVFGAGTVSYFDRDGDVPVWKTDPLILAAGAPLVGQAKVNVSGGMKLTGDAYAYVGIRPLKVDETGRFTRMEFWPVQCGPPSKTNDGFTEHPAAGVRVEPVTSSTSADANLGRLCTIDDPAVMRRVAGESEAWAERKGVGRWLRDKAD